MASLLGRFRSWLGSVEFAVTAAAVVVALTASVLAFEYAGDSADGYFVILLAGVGVPTVYDDQWPVAYERRSVAVAWALVASVAAVACYFLLAAGLRTVFDGFTPSAAAFALTWLLGILAARTYGRTAA